METVHRFVFWALWILVISHCSSSKQVDGSYSQWGIWSACSTSCNGGIKYRSRSCTSPPPAYGGRECWRLGSPVESQTCNTHKCPVHGGYSLWSSWSSCSRSCAGGAQRRFRSCTSPPPAHGGRNCSGQGEATEFRKCNKQRCPVPPSAVTAPQVAYVHVGSSASFTCQASGFPVPSITWMRQSGSSVIVADNVKYQVMSSSGSSRLTIKNVSYSDHGYYTCSALNFKRASARTFLGVIKDAHPRAVEEYEYSLFPEVDGGYSEWSSWSECTATCGIATQQRTRSCTNPTPAPCSGLVQETKKCTSKHCPAPPRARIVPVVVSGREGSSASFICQASGFPAPSITWVRHGSSVIVADNVKYQVLSSSGSSRLTIKNISFGDRGYYTCNASNYEYHLARAFLGVITLRRYSASCPWTSYRATMGNKVKICCPVYGFPPPMVTWKFPDGTVRKTRNTVLHITPNKNGDFGTYTCSVTGLKEFDPVIFSIYLREKFQG